ncbi:MAG: hypothetical protein Q8L68_03420, partial [Methylococcales bacterium]|nr:hypothetical protein [Methylococcales bacterium]
MQKYAHPPIKEAVIDIQLIFDSPLDIEKIKSYILDFEHANYSLKNSIIEGTIGFDLTDSNINNSNNSVSIIGCRTETPDGSYIAQL